MKCTAGGDLSVPEEISQHSISELEGRAPSAAMQTFRRSSFFTSVTGVTDHDRDGRRG